jgi:ribosomal protein S27AE
VIVPAASADTFLVTSVTVECLRCGERHELRRSDERWIEQGDCPRCGYVGWAESAILTEPLRRALRERPLEARRIYV